jgi:hypothetical protein
LQVATVRIRQGRLVIGSGLDEADIPATWPADVLLRLWRARPDDAAAFSLAAWDLETVLGLGLLGKADDTSRGIEPSFSARIEAARRWKQRGTVAAVASAARAAVRGRLSPRIAAQLAHVAFTGEDAAEVDDFLALVAFSLQHVARSGGRYSVRPCALCMKPFLATVRASYCQRKAPVEYARGSQPNQTCLQVAKVRDHRARQRAQKEK